MYDRPASVPLLESHEGGGKGSEASDGLRFAFESEPGADALFPGIEINSLTWPPLLSPPVHESFNSRVVNPPTQ